MRSSRLLKSDSQRAIKNYATIYVPYIILQEKPDMHLPYLLPGWVQYLESHGVALKSLKENIDTSAPTGKLVFHIFGALSEFERDLIRERTQAGLLSARARGRLGGRPRGLGQNKQELAMQLYYSKKHTIDKICELVGDISRKTFYNIKNEAEIKRENMHSE